MARAIVEETGYNDDKFVITLGGIITGVASTKELAQTKVNLINAAIDEEIVRATAEKDKPDPNTESLLHECCAALGWSGGTREQVLQVLRTTRQFVFDRVTWGLSGEYENFKKDLTMLDNLIRERK